MWITFGDLSLIQSDACPGLLRFARCCAKYAYVGRRGIPAIVRLSNLAIDQFGQARLKSRNPAKVGRN
jgi:hypothetical protein